MVTFPLCHFMLASTLITARAVALNTTVKIGIVLSDHIASPMAYSVVAPAINLAIERSLTDFNIAFEPVRATFPGSCAELQALASLVRVVDAGVEVVFGPGCAVEFLLASKFLTVHRIPLLTGAGSYVDDMEAWPFAMRTAFNIHTAWVFFGELCRRFEWTRMFIVHEPENTQIGVTGRGMDAEGRKSREKPLYTAFYREIFVMAKVIQALNESADFLLEPSCSEDVAVVSKLIKVLKVPIMTC
ncbi:hypothetical protein BV898_16621 [Hypsibius exemplaris]|uniref:Receptor ligand binding region domain-containing protein n=1 Tax=Hypsibius exemplaris TaxID=2072580 RepID=A0A9X6RM08_HYPEX|nr:hypothetical protein BV898_16621 [Hypsibius exemplaris]